MLSSRLIGVATVLASLLFAAPALAAPRHLSARLTGSPAISGRVAPQLDRPIPTLSLVLEQQ